MVYAINNWAATSGGILQGLSVMDNLFRSLCYRNLPSGVSWIDHLDILSAVRVFPVGSFKKFDTHYCTIFEGYTCVGIQRDSENYAKALKILQEVRLPATLLVPHELNEGYVRLNVRDRTSIVELSSCFYDVKNSVIRKVNSQEVNVLNMIWDLYSHDTKLIEQVKRTFMERWDSFDTLRSIHTWWESMPKAFVITPIGKVLAHVNAQKYSKIVPGLNNM